MSFSKLDPSIALGFYCETEKDLDDLCMCFTIQDKTCRPMFEIHKQAPKAWTCEDTSVKKSTKVPSRSPRGISLSDFTVFDGISAAGCSVDDEEFEMI
uniref:Uncharacterized protein n=1 Tax=Arion vulgaris TaxID=1028688 RepID=A0A0B6ZTM7_9EUPU